ncbi:TY-Chap2 family putative peptide chaperone [Rathayibacter soli]|uniref:TY-Chap2 family putative peptide chaperone n=1 Tax=Rathayibacter soli TaxID=3144168 RepID=UPI0027E4B43A|nr:hypothetical protein [Glaciibacter superstes]
MTGHGPYEDYRPPANRFLHAHTWWIASELVRRHPHLRIGTVLTDSNDRLLLVYDEPDAYRLQFDLVGGAKYKLSGEVYSISWIEMMAGDNPHEVIKRLEAATGLGVPKNTPATTPKALVYRVVASALAVGVNDRHDWYAEEVTYDFQSRFEEQAVFARFASVKKAAGEYYLRHFEKELVGARPEVFFQPFVALMRDLVPVAIFDIAGVAHTADGSKDLMHVFNDYGRRVTPTMAYALERSLS